MTRKEFWAWLDGVYRGRSLDIAAGDKNWIASCCDGISRRDETELFAIVRLSNKTTAAVFLSSHLQAHYKRSHYKSWLKQWEKRDATKTTD